MRIVIKVILILVTLWIAGIIVTILRAMETGVLPSAIIGIAMIAAIRAIWKYKPSTSDDITLKKDN